MSEHIELTAPLDGDFGAVVRLIVGGISARVDLGFEEMDDLQLAIERLHAEAGGQERLTLDFDLSPGRVRVRLGPLLERGLADALQRGPVAGALTLKGVLDTLVDSYGVEEAADGRLFIRIVKLVNA
ncbi:MAG: hypothetical protein H0T19_00335 [Thermoleophilaceae bacterium]|nr:hypothetical protein [Thermoleophilaceae bacterium]